MHCLTCGTDIGSGIGVCSKCKERRRSPQSPYITPFKSRGRTSIFAFLNKYPTAICVAALIPIGIYLIISAFSDENISITSKSGKIVLTAADNSSSVVYDVGPRSQQSIRVFSYDVQQLAFSHGAFRSHLAYLSDDEYMQFKDIRGCAAGFLNAHVKHLLIVPRSEEDSLALKTVTLKEGDKVTVSMNDLFPVEIKFQNYRLKPDQWFSGNRIVSIDSVKH